MFLPFWSHHSVLALLSSMTWEKTAVFYISFVLLDGQRASCFCLLSFHKNLRKCRSKPSAKPSTKSNKLLYLSELDESSLLFFFFFLWWVAPSFLHVQWQKLYLTELFFKPCPITGCLFIYLWWICMLYRCFQAKWVFHVTVVKSRELYEW